MTTDLSESRLAEIRHANEVRLQCDGVWQSTHPLRGEWVPDLLAAIDARDGLLSDLAQDNAAAHEIIRADERARIAQACIGDIGSLYLNRQLKILASLGPVVPLPISEVRQECARLREVVKEVAELNISAHSDHWLIRLVEIARKALEPT